MSDLIVIRFQHEFKAGEVLIELSKLERKYLVNLKDAAIVIRNKADNVKMKQTHKVIDFGEFREGLWELLIGLIFFPPMWAIFWARFGGIFSALTDIGINENFIREIGNMIEPGTSAIFFLVKRSTPDKFLDELSQFEGKVLRTSLSKEDEAKLQVASTKDQLEIDA